MTDKKDPALAETAISHTSAASLPMGRHGPDPVGVIADRYEIEALLGVGGMGRVYRARDRSLDETVALKLMRSDLTDEAGVVERFRQEVKLARRVTDVHVVRTFDLGQHGDDHFLTMEYIAGRSLARVLEEGIPPAAEALRIAREVCAGICAAHAAGVLHRDLKPDNVLVATTGRIAISDFGIARPSAAPTATVDRFVGTPAYMAPEQVDGRAPIGTYTDVYAFGAMLFEMLAGRRPFIGTDAVAVAVARLTQPPPDPRSVRAVPAALADLVLRCLALDPKARFADAAALSAALAALTIDSVTAGPTPQPIIPAKTSVSIAVLPLRAGGEHAEMARGLTEEIVDALSMTRALRVRPLSVVRKHATDDADPRELGTAVGVDVVVDGALRSAGTGLRLSARATGVADGFQLWADRFEVQADRLLDASDAVARAVARALTVELATPERATSDGQVMAQYLEGKAKLRAGWASGVLAGALKDLETALAAAPADAAILATTSLALSRLAFYGAEHASPRAFALAERAVTVAPDLGEPWLALGIAALYGQRITEAARALVRAVSLGPGVVLAQATVGGLALEVGLVDEGIAHLEAAFALDPSGMHAGDLARAYVYAGRTTDAFSVLARTVDNEIFIQSQVARFKAWAGESHDYEPKASRLPGDVGAFSQVLFRVHRTRQITPEDRAYLKTATMTPNPRFRAVRAQFAAEVMLFVGDHDGALEQIAVAVDNGMYDHAWFERCPALAPLRGNARLAEIAALVAERAAPVQRALSGRP